MGEAISDRAASSLFYDARSYDVFRPKPVPEALIRRAWAMARMGPTSANQLPARLAWCISQESRDRLADCAFGDNCAKIRNAPLAVVIGYDLDFHELLPSLFARADARQWFVDPELRRVSAFRNGTLQGAYLILALRAVGLDVGPMSAFNHDAVDQEFFKDFPSYKSNFLCVAGYGDKASLPPRDRRPEFEEFNLLA